MLSTEAFFAAFGAAGFLKEATWTSKRGDAAATGDVRLRGRTELVVGDLVQVVDYSIEYPTSLFPDLAEDDSVTVDGVNYVVRLEPHLQLDGTRAIAALRKV